MPSFVWTEGGDLIGVYGLLTSFVFESAVYGED